MIPSYSKIWHLGHEETKMMKGPIVIQEKIDGSQFSFAKINGELFLKSKNTQIVPEAAPKLFENSVNYVLKIKDFLNEGWIYRGEALFNKKHNALIYGRVPENNIIIFDIEPNEGNFLLYDDMKKEAKRLGLEVVSLLLECDTIEEASKKTNELLELQSALGGTLIEGVVFKTKYPKDVIYGRFQKIVMAKFVSEAFKETNKVNWKQENPGKKDIIKSIANVVSNPARWEKGIQRLKEADNYKNSPQDIGPLIKEVRKDIEEECEDVIKDMLYNTFLNNILRLTTNGIPQWYKEKLANFK